MAMIESKFRATSDPAARKSVLDDVSKQGVENVLFWFSDIEGHLKSFAITPSEMEGALNDGWASTGRRSPASMRSRSRTWSRSPIPPRTVFCPRVR